MANTSVGWTDVIENGGGKSAPAPADRNSSSRSAARVADPCIIVIFGASGDLATRKLLPAICSLAKSHLISDRVAVVGIARDPLSREEFQDKMRNYIRAYREQDLSCNDWLIQRLYYFRADATEENRYRDLAELLHGLDESRDTPGNYLYYLATAPSLFPVIVKQLGSCGLTRQEPGKWRRVVIEKPFGHDLKSAQALNRQLRQVLDEDQIYRIDHYLGKETVQNILVFRFSNGIFEPIWNRRYIDHVQITAAETLGVEHRAAYYDQTGALRDMVPSHMMQLLSLTAMEPPSSFHADAIRDEQAKVLHSVSPFAPEEVLRSSVRGQYGEGAIEGTRVPAYRAEPQVAPDSNTETFVALKLSLDNWRWAGVPFYLRTGKRLAKRVSEIAIHFRQAPFTLFKDTPVEQLAPNVLLMNIQPDEGMSLRFGVKVPGLSVRIGAVNMEFRYADYFGSELSTGYERLLCDCMLGDATLFLRADVIEAVWSIIDVILDVWQALPPRSLPNYPAGTWGPYEAFDLLHKDGGRWREMDEARDRSVQLRR